MLTLEQAVTIQILHQQGKSIKAITRELGVSRNTVRKYLRQNTTPQYQRIQPRISILDPYKPYLLQRVNAAHPEWIPAVVLYQEILRSKTAFSTRPNNPRFLCCGTATFCNVACCSV